MNDTDKDRPENGDDDLLAAEYVLGVLPAAERASFATRLTRDRNLVRLVESWQQRLSPMDADYPEMAPPAAVKRSVDERLFAPGSQAQPRTSFWNSLAFWRAGAIAAFAALLVAVVVLAVTAPPGAPPVRYAASLSADASDVRYVAVFDKAHSTLDLSHLAGKREAGHDFELWVIKGDDAPVSLGVIPAGEAVHLQVAAGHASLLAKGSVLAVSNEPVGGSPTGQPTGAVLALGEIHAI